MSGQYLNPAAMISQKIDASVRAKWHSCAENCGLTVQTGTVPFCLPGIDIFEPPPGYTMDQNSDFWEIIIL